MGRPPCCDKVEIRKGPWTPEEDIILLSYIQEHGPGKWRSVPINTCLMRCSKSCRLRWTNYLRPGIKHGNFTPHEEDIIVRLQSFLGNKWATIASYLPQRTDSNIKNYWYTHLKKKLNKHQVIGAIISPPPPPSEPSIVASHVDHHHDRTRTHPLCKDSYARPTSSNPADEVTQPIGQCSPITTTNGYYNSSSSYAFSVDNISKLLNGFKKSTPTQGDATNIKPSSAIYNDALFPFEHMSGGALTPISEVPPLMPLPPPQEQLSSIEDWLCHQATEQVVDQLAEISDVCCSSFPMLL